ncbi:MAG TPA: ABC transporter ATP-binding protein [Chloroflexota bacterium]|nr:ABC transporter ATP-binding protein [Chloroflexota bacterium]
MDLTARPATPATRALEAHDLYRFYHSGEDETLALRGVNFQVDLGETVAVVGPSGSGKSTLLACLAGLDEPDGGYVLLRGQRLTRRTESERAAMRAAHVGILLQSGNLLEHLSVEDNIALPMRIAGAFDESRQRELLVRVGLHHRRRARPSELSGGESARAGLAVAFACNPTVLLADEPTGEVDADTEQQILELFDEHQRGGGALVIATHSDALAGRARRIVRLVDGRVADA